MCRIIATEQIGDFKVHYFRCPKSNSLALKGNMPIQLELLQNLFSYFRTASEISNYIRIDMQYNVKGRWYVLDDSFLEIVHFTLKRAVRKDGENYLYADFESLKNPHISYLMEVYNEKNTVQKAIQQVVDTQSEISEKFTAALKKDFENFKEQNTVRKQLNTMNNPIKPDHYKLPNGLQVIDLIEDWGLGFHAGNALKYMMRAGKKDGNSIEQDIDKAIWYLQRLVEKAIKPKSDKATNKYPLLVITGALDFSHLTHAITNLVAFSSASAALIHLQEFKATFQTTK